VGAFVGAGASEVGFVSTDHYVAERERGCPSFERNHPSKEPCDPAPVNFEDAGDAARRSSGKQCQRNDEQPENGVRKRPEIL
jgi:hypothetical protein